MNKREMTPEQEIIKLLMGTVENLLDATKKGAVVIKDLNYRVNRLELSEEKSKEN